VSDLAVPVPLVEIEVMGVVERESVRRARAVESSSERLPLSWPGAATLYGPVVGG